MTTLVDTLAEVVDVLTPLVPGTFAAVLDAPPRQVNQFPTAEVRLGRTTIQHDPAGQILERRNLRTGAVLMYLPNVGTLPEQYRKYAPLIDAVLEVFGEVPTLNDVTDRFAASGYSAVGFDESLGCFRLDVDWQAIDIEAGTYIQDWLS